MNDPNPALERKVKSLLVDFLNDKGIGVEEGFGYWIKNDEFGGVEKTIRETIGLVQAKGVDPEEKASEISLYVFSLLGRAYMDSHKG